MNEKLIEEVKKYKILYNRESIDYKNKKKRAAAWNMIARKLNIPESTCQSRWKSLRDRYVKECKKLRFSSDSACEMTESQWIYYPKMKFFHEQFTRNNEGLTSIEEKLIEMVRKYEILYARGGVHYKTMNERAAAWDVIAKSLNIPVKICKTRWKSLRDRYVRELNKANFTSDSACEVAESQWIYYANMQFLRDVVTPKKTLSSIHPQFVNKIEFGEERLDPLASSDDSTADASDCDVMISSPAIDDTNSCSETASTSHHSRKRSAYTNEFEDLKEISTIVENNSCTRNDFSADDGNHTGFFLMVQDFFAKMPEEFVDDSKVFIINHLHNQVKEYKKNFVG